MRTGGDTAGKRQENVGKPRDGTRTRAEAAGTQRADVICDADGALAAPAPIKFA